MIRTTVLFAIAIAASVMFNACKVNYSFKQGSIPAEIQTVSISRFQNSALFASPAVASTFTETLQDKFIRETRLTQVSDGGDLDFEGEVTRYESNPSSISANDQATMNRLSITVMVRFTNNYDPSASFSRNFTAYADYSTSQSLQSVEGTLLPEICEDLANQIYNAAFSNW